MRNFIWVISLIQLGHVAALSQVYLDSAYTNQIYFGPNNVYPLSQSICDSYIDFLTDVKNKITSEVDATSQPNELQIFNTEIDQLSGLWSTMKSRLESFKDINSLCVDEVLTEKGFTTNDYEVIEAPYVDEVTIIEYIDAINIKLDKTRWDKQKVKDCQPRNSEDCYVWCLITHEEAFEDSHENPLRVALLTEQLDFQLKDDRLYREVLLEVTTDLGYILQHKEKEKKYSISKVAMVECR